MPKIHQFYEKLIFNVESLATLGKLDTIQGAAFFVIVRKLELLKRELVTHVPGDWRDWTFPKLLEALRKWTETNAVMKVDKRATTKRGSTWQKVVLSRRTTAMSTSIRTVQTSAFIATAVNTALPTVTKCLRQQNVRRS